MPSPHLIHESELSWTDITHGYHLANEEAIYVLAGQGSLRLGEETLPLKAGDYVALPAGPGTAHQLFNEGPEPLRYLALSTMQAPDIVMYPDSRKVGVFGGAAPGETRPRASCMPTSPWPPRWTTGTARTRASRSLAPAGEPAGGGYRFLVRERW
ncbi:cupin domain-containing protein [Stigmatella erecta]|uniref:Cupin domain-containing protein n=1 Tax=Stigmatella erecta TaxID=83460 RepID=A0A1I0LAR3_9BACT|nr:cupin domain-containing protein [Stigmatella erecta]SEU36571.1 Cupin domain-containing protein [Stigmatella erecta]